MTFFKILMVLATQVTPGGSPDDVSTPSLASADGEATVPNASWEQVPQQDRFWFRMDYLSWWTEGADLPPLLTGSLPGTPRGLAGVLGPAGTPLLLGGERSDAGRHDGMRLRSGFWFDCGQHGIDFEFFSLGSDPLRFASRSPGSVILARPFFNSARNRSDAQLVAFPTVVAGRFIFSSDTTIRGGSFHLRSALADYRDEADVAVGRVDLVVGYRTMQFDEGLRIQEELESLAPLSRGTLIGVRDDFAVQNQFHGLEVGIESRHTRGIFTLEWLTRLAIGSTHQSADIAGGTAIIVPGFSSARYSGGLLGQATNIGHHQRDRFSVLPELGVTLTAKLCDRVQVVGGYTAIYWSDVARAGDQIDLAVNATQIPPGRLAGTRRPTFRFRDDDFWMHGWNLGLELRF